MRKLCFIFIIELTNNNIQIWNHQCIMRTLFAPNPIYNFNQYYTTNNDTYYYLLVTIARFIVDEKYVPWSHGFSVWEKNPMCSVNIGT